jgi:DNA-binding transcriptional MerR regulator
MSKPTTTASYLRIGQIAKRSGVSAKALRLYEQRGLLKPCAHSEAGYRLYGPDALRRLMQIVVLKRSGFSLAEIGRLFTRDATATASLFTARIETLERDLADRVRALETLRRIAWHAGSASTLDLDQLLESIHMGSTLKLDLSDAERDVVRQRAEQIGGDSMKALRSAYPDLIAQMRAAMEAGTPPTDAVVVAAARRYRALAPAMPDVDATVRKRLVDSVGARADVMAEHGLDPALFRYLCAAIEAAKAGESR